MKPNGPTLGIRLLAQVSTPPAELPVPGLHAPAHAEQLTLYGLAGGGPTLISATSADGALVNRGDVDMDQFPAMLPRRRAATSNSALPRCLELWRSMTETVAMQAVQDLQAGGRHGESGEGVLG